MAHATKYSASNKTHDHSPITERNDTFAYRARGPVVAIYVPATELNSLFCYLRSLPKSYVKLIPPLRFARPTIGNGCLKFLHGKILIEFLDCSFFCVTLSYRQSQKKMSTALIVRKDK